MYPNLKTMKTTLLSTKKSLLTAVAITLISLTGFTQTYTSIAAGDWSSASTWSNGIVPPATIAAGSTVNVMHKVTYSANTNLVINGTLNVTNDTLFFPNSFNKDINVNNTGIVRITNAGLSQLSSGNASFNLNGKLFLSNGYFLIAKDFSANAGSVQSYKNSTVVISRNFSTSGSAISPAIDTIQFTNIKVGNTSNGNFTNNSFAKLYVGNAYVQVLNNGNFTNAAFATISVLPGSNSNFGFDFLKSMGNLQNDGLWNARIDASCISGSINGIMIADIDFTRSPDCSATPQIGPAPELVFDNPVLVSGIDKKQGAIYRFANVISGVDAEIRLKKFSRPDITINSIDNTSFGWSKAFQPEFGLAGNVAPYQNWYIDFELKFYVAGTSTPKVMPKVDMTALDVDGDGVSISEYATFQNPSNVSYATLSSLVQVASSLVGTLAVCPQDNISSLLKSCNVCGGDGKTGIWNLDDCTACNGTGILYTACNHAYDDVNGTTEEGPVTNFVNIDTASTQVMTVYQFTDRQTINFRYGAKSGASTSNAGLRLNSLWFRQFSLTPFLAITLPVKMQSFTATLRDEQTKKVDLKWTTASEINLSHFVIERSTDGRNYSDAAVVFSYGSESAKTNYSFTDNLGNLNTGVFYYRIRSVDNDGKETYSEVRIIRIQSDVKQTMNIIAYPNPATTDLRITIPSQWQNKAVVYEVFNSGGSVIYKKAVAASGQTEVINVSNFSTGVYFVRANCMGEIAQQKIIKK